MRKSDVLIALEKLERAFTKLKEGVNTARDELERDGVIQRFEFTTELLWKALRIVLEYNGIECSSPRKCIKEAFRHGLIDDDEVLLDMLEDRNRTSHIYSEETAREIFERIRKVYVIAIEKAMNSVKNSL